MGVVCVDDDDEIRMGWNAKFVILLLAAFINGRSAASAVSSCDGMPHESLSVMEKMAPPVMQDSEECRPLSTAEAHVYCTMAWCLLFADHLRRGMRLAPAIESQTMKLAITMVAAVLGKSFPSLVASADVPAWFKVLPFPIVIVLAIGHLVENTAASHILSRWLSYCIAWLYKKVSLDNTICILSGLLKFYGWWPRQDGASLLKDAGLSAGHWMKLLKLGVLERRRSESDAQLLRRLGYTLSDIKEALPSVSATMLRDVGFSPMEIESAGFPSLITLQAVLLSGAKLLDEGYTVEATDRIRDVLDDIESVVKKQCVLAFEDSPIHDYSQTVRDCGMGAGGSNVIVNVWIRSAKQIKFRNWPLAEIQAAGYTGYTDQELIEAGYTLPGEKNMLYDYADVLCSFDEY